MTVTCIVTFSIHVSSYCNIYEVWDYTNLFKTAPQNTIEKTNRRDPHQPPVPKSRQTL